MVPLGPIVAAALRSEALLGGEAIAGEGLLGQLLGRLGLQAEGQTEIMVPVSSSAISAIGYSVGEVITVVFVRGGTYHYPGDEDLFLEFLMAPSKGQFFNSHFR